MSLAPAAALAAACADPDPGPDAHPCVTQDLPPLAAAEPDHSTAVVDITTDLAVCQGTLDELDRRVERLGGALGLEVSRRIPLIMSVNPSDACEGDATVRGCARANGEVVAVPSTVFHELAHGVACELGRSDRLYEEGFATAFDGTDAFAEDDVLTTIASSVGGSTVDYTTADRFVRWLHKAHGPDAFAAAYDRTDLAGGDDAFNEMAVDVFGEDAAELEERFRAERPFFSPAAWDRCTGPVAPWSGNDLRIDVDLDCSSPETRGPYLEKPLLGMSADSMYAVFTVEGRDDAEYLLQLDGREGLWMLGEPILDWGVRVEECHTDPIADLTEAQQTQEARTPTIATITKRNDRGFEFLPGRRYRVELVAPMAAGARQLSAEFVRYEDDPPPACQAPIPDPSCDPRDATSCTAQETCALADCSFSCADGAGELADGEPCSESGAIGECTPSSMCIPASLFPACSGVACCTAYCDTDAPDCAPDLECFPVFAADAAPAGLETLGACVGE